MSFAKELFHFTIFCVVYISAVSAIEAEPPSVGLEYFFDFIGVLSLMVLAVWVYEKSS